MTGTLSMPGLWCLGELVRGSWVMGFGWLSIGYAYVDSLFKSWAPAAGVYGVGLVVNLLIGALLVLLTGQQDKRRVVVRAATAIWAGVLALSTVALDLVQWSKPAQSIEVRVVQADLPVAMRLTQSMQAQRAARVEAMSRRSAMSSHIDLIVWPEGVFGYPVQRLGAESLRAVLGTASSMQTELLFNGFSQAAGARVFNSNWLAAPNGERNDLGAQIREVYQKHHLVPFGEFVPAGFRWFVDALGIPMADQSAGPAGGAGPVSAAGIPAALTVCYENMFGEELRQWWRHRLDAHCAGRDSRALIAAGGAKLGFKACFVRRRAYAVCALWQCAGRLRSLARCCVRRRCGGRSQAKGCAQRALSGPKRRFLPNLIKFDPRFVRRNQASADPLSTHSADESGVFCHGFCCRCTRPAFAGRLTFLVDFLCLLFRK